MLVVKKLGEDPSKSKYKISIDDKKDNKKPNSVIVSTHGVITNTHCNNISNTPCNPHKPSHHHNHNHDNHSDHYIESQHHGKDECFPIKPPCDKPSVSKPKPQYCEHPRRHTEPLEYFDRKFPRQEVMLLDIETSVKQTVVIKFKYNTGDIIKYVAEGDIVHAYFIDKGDSTAQLTEITGKISYIDFVNQKLFIDYSEMYTACKIDIYISSLRFISTDLYEVAPFFEKDDEPIIEEPDEEIVKPLEPEYSYDENIDPNFSVDPELIDPGFSVDPEPINPDFSVDD